MKSCPTCRRNFDDDTLLYCTEDGSPLIMSQRSVDPTLRIPSARNTDPPATEMLPHGYQPPSGANSATWPVEPGRTPSGSEPTQVPPTQFAGQVPPTQFAGNVPPPPSYPPVAPAYQPTSTPPAPNRAPWIIMTAVLGVVALGAIVGVAYLLLRPTDTANKNAQPPTSPSPTPNTNSNTGGGTGNTNTGGDDGGSSTTDWLEGEWEGSGDNPDGGTWSILLIRDEEGTAISYPKLNCTGVWEEKTIDGDTATFTERIRSGTCDDGTSIKVTRLTENQISVSWIVEDSDIPVISATLNRTRSPQGK